MTTIAIHGPAGTRVTAGIVSHPSPFPVAETVARLTEAIRDAGATLFGVIDQAAHARAVGLALRETRLVIFGNPGAGRAVMAAAPLAALDLPLKVLVWQDDAGTVWASHLDADWVAARHRLPEALARPLRATMAVTRAALAPAAPAVVR